MQKSTIIEITIAIIILISSVFIKNDITPSKTVNNISLPVSVGNLKGEKIEPEEEEKNFIESTGTNIIKSKYGIYTVSLISSDDIKCIHNPAICYNANGYTVNNEEVIKLTPDIKVAKLTINKDTYNPSPITHDTSHITIYYWFFNKNIITTEYKDVFFSSAGGEKNWNLITIAFQEKENPGTGDFLLSVFYLLNKLQ